MNIVFLLESLGTEISPEILQKSGTEVTQISENSGVLILWHFVMTLYNLCSLFYILICLILQCEVSFLFIHIDVSKKSYGYLGGPGQKPQNKQPKFLKLLILVHLRNYFIEPLNKFLMCFEIMG